jgi:hypothetical protein
MTNYEIFQLKKYGNYVGADGQLHTVDCIDTNCMMDENDEFENGFVNIEELGRWFHAQAELQILEKQH